VTEEREPKEGRNLFAPVTPTRVSTDIVKQITGAIRDGRLAVGDRLPSERQLTERFKVSRVTVRDALRTLEALGLIQIRLGARGGAIVTSPVPESVGERFTDMVLLSDMKPEEVTEARQILELGGVELACLRATAEDIEALNELCEMAEQALAEDRYQVDLSAAFHVRLALATHNGAIAMIIESLHGPMLMAMRRAQEIDSQFGDPGIKEHREIVQAISDRDPERARRTMEAHLARTAERFKESL
jgi:GntR family transcriptional repressor for pyruvate dehydrogenase complex